MNSFLWTLASMQSPSLAMLWPSPMISPKWWSTTGRPMSVPTSMMEAIHSITTASKLSLHLLPSSSCANSALNSTSAHTSSTDRPFHPLPHILSAEASHVWVHLPQHLTILSPFSPPLTTRATILGHWSNSTPLPPFCQSLPVTYHLLLHLPKAPMSYLANEPLQYGSVPLRRTRMTVEHLLQLYTPVHLTLPVRSAFAMYAQTWWHRPCWITAKSSRGLPLSQSLGGLWLFNCSKNRYSSSVHTPLLGCKPISKG